MSRLGNHEFRPQVIYNWRTVVGMICGKGVLRVL